VWAIPEVHVHAGFLCHNTAFSTPAGVSEMPPQHHPATSIVDTVFQTQKGCLTRGIGSPTLALTFRPFLPDTDPIKHAKQNSIMGNHAQHHAAFKIEKNQKKLKGKKIKIQKQSLPVSCLSTAMAASSSTSLVTNFRAPISLQV
jgi:hypothetical protein